MNNLINPLNIHLLYCLIIHYLLRNFIIFIQLHHFLIIFILIFEQYYVVEDTFIHIDHFPK